MLQTFIRKAHENVPYAITGFVKYTILFPQEAFTADQYIGSSVHNISDPIFALWKPLQQAFTASFWVIIFLENF